MVLMEIALALEILLTATGIASTELTASNNKKFQTVANQLQEAMNKNSNLRSRLMDAYNMKNTNLLNSILASSPIGNGYKRLQAAITQNDAEYQTQTKALDEANEKLAKAAAETDKLSSLANSGSLIGGIVAKVKGDKVSKSANEALDYNSQINGGIERNPNN